LVKNAGKSFEEQLKQSAIDQGIYIYRIKDVPQMMLKRGARVSKNDFDSFIYKKPNLFPIELKSTQSKSISFNEKIIKSHQIKALEDASKYDGLIAGFIMNFRDFDNETYFVHINEFVKLKYYAENQIKDHKYKSKLNKSSISLDNCREIGVPLLNRKKQVKYTYYVNKLLDELIERYGVK